MYAIEYFVGAKFGGWARGDGRFVDADQAMKRAEYDRTCEARALATKIVRRVVRIAK